MNARSATTMPDVSRRKGHLRGWAEHLWETFLVGCVIAETSTIDSCWACESTRPYVEEALRIRAVGRLSAGPARVSGSVRARRRFAATED